MLVNPGYGVDVRLQPPLSPPSPRIKHSSFGDQLRLSSPSPSPVKSRIRHKSEPMTGENNVYVHIPLLVYKAPLNMLTYMYQCIPGVFRGGGGEGANVLDNLVKSW